MHTAYLVITLITAIITGGIAVADFIPQDSSWQTRPRSVYLVRGCLRWGRQS
jgi:hypothetical protein